MQPPSFPDRPITFRMLLVHTSSIADTREVLQPLYVDGDAEESFGELVTSYLSPTAAATARSWSTRRAGLDGSVA